MNENRESVAILIGSCDGRTGKTKPLLFFIKTAVSFMFELKDHWHVSVSEVTLRENGSP